MKLNRGTLAARQEKAQNAWNTLFCFAAGFLLSSAAVMGRRLLIAPALAAAASFSPPGIFCIAGAALACLVPVGGQFAVRALCCVLIITAGRLLLCTLLPEGRRGLLLFEPALAVSVILSTGAADLIAEKSGMADVFVLLVETALTVPAIYIIREVKDAVSSKTLTGAALKTRAFAFVLAFVIALSAAQLSLFGVCPARIIFSVCALLTLLEGGELCALMIACAGGVLTSLSGLSPAYALMLTASAAAAIFARRAKGLVWFCTYLLFSLSAGTDFLVPCLVEALLTLLLCRLLPRSFKAALTSVFGRFFPSASGVTAADRLCESARIFANMSEDSHTLDAPDQMLEAGGIEPLLADAIDSVCRTCKNAHLCWIADYNGTMNCLQECAARLRLGKISPRDLSEPIQSRCKRKAEFCAGISDSCRKAIDERRAVWNAADHYGAFSLLLSELAEDDGEFKRDFRLSAQIEDFLISQGITTHGVGAYFNRRGLLTVEAVLAVDTPPQEKISALFAELFRLTGKKDFEACFESRREGKYCLITEKEAIFVSVSRASRAREGEETSGDTLTAFKTRGGKYVVILSDGMGSGTRAKRHSSFFATYTEQLIRGGASPETALFAVSGILSAENASDCFATADLLVIDLYTSEAQFIKAGAAPSLLMRNGRFQRLKSSSLPLGILPTARPEHTRVRLCDGDTVIMVTDGLVLPDGDTVQIEELCKKAKKHPSKSLAAQLIEGVRLCRRTDGRDDDDMSAAVITVRSRR